MLNDDCYRTGISSTPICKCGNLNETPQHFLLQCVNYYNARCEMFENISDATAC